MILYFTGTGNSAFVARRVGTMLADEVISLKEKIRSNDTSPLYSETPWVICTPVYAWQLPHLVRDWLRRTPLEGSRDVYFLLTCGDEIGNAGAYARKLCRTKGMSFRGCTGIIMPENYIAMFDAPERDEAVAIIGNALPAIDAAAETIQRLEDLPDANCGALDYLKSGIVNASFYALFLHSRRFQVDTASCTGCGQCVRLCPLGAISLQQGTPVWKDPCTHCMACICHCPQGAIEYGKASVGKPRYTCPEAESSRTE